MKTYESVTLLKNDGNHKAGKTIRVTTATADNMEAKGKGKRPVKVEKVEKVAPKTTTTKTTTKPSE